VLRIEPCATTIRMDLGSRGNSLPIGYFGRRAKRMLGKFFRRAGR
jgi:hypothetical protein